MLLQDLAESLGPLAPQGMNRLPILDEMVEFVVVHEVAHQWWNGLVGSDSEHHPFIDEGMAQYSSVLYFEDRYGTERAEKTGDRQVKLNYLVYRMMGNADAAVDRATGDFSGPLEYAALVYGKGPYFYPAVRRAVGDDVFWQTLRRYYDENLYKVAAPESFARIAGEVSGRMDELLGLHRHWFLEAHGDEDLGQANLTQLLELLLGDAAGAGDLPGQLQGGGDGGLDLTQLMGLMQAMGGVAGDAGAGSMPDLDQILALVQSMQGGASDAGTGGPGLVVLPGGVDGGGTGGMGQLFAMARQVLRPLAAQDPNIAKLLDLLERMERGDQVSPAELLEAAQVALQSLGGLLGGADGGGEWMQLLQLLNMMGPGAAL
jgi:hypothetical protein